MSDPEADHDIEAIGRADEWGTIQIIRVGDGRIDGLAARCRAPSEKA